jgi:HEAT repeat protein
MVRRVVADPTRSPHHALMSDASTMRSRRLPFWVVIIALVVCALGGVFVLLWFKLPTWAPAWVVEYSPWVDPIVRAVEYDSEIEAVARKLASRGGSVAPAMVGYLESTDPMTVNLACRVLREVTNPMMVEPVIAKLKQETALSSMDRSALIDALAKQSAGVVMDSILPIPETKNGTTFELILLLGRLDDPRAVATLREIIWEDPPTELSGLQIWASPATFSAAALTYLPVPQAREILKQALADSVESIRVCALAGLVLPVKGKREPLGEEICRVVVDRLDDPDARVRKAAIMVAEFHFLPGAEAVLVAKLERAEPADRRTLLFGLGAPHTTDAAIPVIAKHLRDEDPKIQCAAADALGRTKKPAVVPFFREAFSSLSELARTAVLLQMRSPSLHTNPEAVPLLFLALETEDDELAKLAGQTLLKMDLDEDHRLRLDAWFNRSTKPVK